jgi:hypothetical protein
MFSKGDSVVKTIAARPRRSLVYEHSSICVALCILHAIFPARRQTSMILMPFMGFQKGSLKESLRRTSSRRMEEFTSKMCPLNFANFEFVVFDVFVAKLSLWIPTCTWCLSGVGNRGLKNKLPSFG